MSGTQQYTHTRCLLHHNLHRILSRRRQPRSQRYLLNLLDLTVTFNFYQHFDTCKFLCFLWTHSRATVKYYSKCFILHCVCNLVKRSSQVLQLDVFAVHFYNLLTCILFLISIFVCMLEVTQIPGEIKFYLSVCLSLCLSVCLSTMCVCVCVCVSIYLSIYLSIFLHVCMYVCMYV